VIFNDISFMPHLYSTGVFPITYFYIIHSLNTYIAFAFPLTFNARRSF
jgi:hypothetical protein